MLDLFFTGLDYGLRFHEQLRKIIDLKLYFFVLVVVALYTAYLNIHLLQDPQMLLFTESTKDMALRWPFGGYIQFIIVLLVASMVINRKVIVFLLKKKYFFAFYDSLSNKISNKDDFVEVWSKYENLCKILERKHRFIDEDSHYNGIVLIYRRINQRCYAQSVLLRRNVNTATMDDDIEYQEKVMLNSYIQKICEYVIDYNHETHLELHDELIIKRFKQTQLEQELINTIKYCHIDGYGFLSTLALENLIGISLLLPQDHRVKILEVLASMPVNNIGWLNRRVFEVVLIGVVSGSMSPNEWHHFTEDIKRLDEEICNIHPKLMFDERVELIKSKFKEKMLAKYLQKQGFRYV